MTRTPTRADRLRTPALAAAIALCLAAAPAAAESWLVLLVDRSGSIDEEELALQRRAYVEVLRDPEVMATLAESRVAIVEFDDQPELVAPWGTVAETAAAYEAWGAFGARGGTGIGRALRAALSMLEGKRGERVVDVSGDGKDNRDSALLERMRDAARDDGVEINGLAIEAAGYDMEDYYTEKVATGFVLRVGAREDFRAALRRKILREMSLAALDPG